MIPYVHISAGTFLQPFGLLVATGVIVGTWLAIRRARKLGFDESQLNSFITWMLVVGFICGHVLDDLFYHPSEVAKKPLKLLMLWDGLSSFGGFTGALIGIVLWKYLTLETVFVIPRGIGRVVGALFAAGIVYLILDNAPQFQTVSDTVRYGAPVVGAIFGWTSVGPDGIPIYRFKRRATPASIFAFADLILSVFPVAWAFGRMGCSSVHDHPGALATKGAMFAVEYPRGFPPGAQAEQVAKAFTGPRSTYGFIEFLHGDLPRYDLGLLELMFTIVLATLLALTWNKKIPTGSYIVATALSYAPVRFAMDFLRITDGEAADPRYGHLTPAQWESIALFAWGLVAIYIIWNNQKKGVDPATIALRPALRKAALKQPQTSV